MEQTINFLNERERQLDDIDKAIRDTEYPPINGGPTLEDLAGLLKGAAATIEDLAYQVDEQEEIAERCEALQDAITDAFNALDDVVDDLEDAVKKLDDAVKKLDDDEDLEASGLFAAPLKTVTDCLGRLMEIRSDLRRA